MAGNDSSLDVAVLGLDGFRLRTATEDDGELLMLVETTASVVGCSGCGTRARSKGRRRTKVRDLPVGGRPTVLVWSKRVWRCPLQGCDVGSWSETSPHIRPRAVLSERARREAARWVGEDGVSVAGGWLVDGDGSGKGVRGTTGRRTAGVFGRCAVSGYGRAPVEVASGSVGNRIRGSRVGPAARSGSGTFRGCCQGFPSL